MGLADGDAGCFNVPMNTPTCFKLRGTVWSLRGLLFSLVRRATGAFSPSLMRHPFKCCLPFPMNTPVLPLQVVGTSGWFLRLVNLVFLVTSSFSLGRMHSAKQFSAQGRALCLCSSLQLSLMQWGPCELWSAWPLWSTDSSSTERVTTGTPTAVPPVLWAGNPARHCSLLCPL